MPPRWPPFQPRATTFFRVFLLVVVLMAGSVAYAVLQYYHSPYWSKVGLAPTQPVQFSHRHHAGELRIDCRFCHATVETSAFAGMPTTQTCLNCHAQIFTDTAMLEPVVRSAVTQQPLAWTRVTRLPDHVFFNHGVHLAGGIACIACHGEVGRMALTAKAQPLDMRQCLNCHRNPEENVRPREELFAAIEARSTPHVETANLVRSGSPANRDHLQNCSTCHH